MGKMKSRLIYEGISPVHTLSMSWTKGSFKTLDDLFDAYGKNYVKETGNTAPVPDDLFIDWFIGKFSHILNTREWRFVKDMSDFTEQVPSLEEDSTLETTIEEGSSYVGNIGDSNILTGPNEDKFINVESSNLEVSTSMTEARERLRKARHPDVVGNIEITEPDNMEQNFAGKSRLDDLQPAGSQVMTGDDLDRVRNRNNPVILEEQRIQNPAEQQELRDSQMANVSKRTRVLNPEELQPDGSRVKIISGDSMNFNEKVNSSINVEEVNTAIVGNSTVLTPNIDNKFYAQAPVMPPITVNDICDNPDHLHARVLISSCKNLSTLKIAKTACYNMGKTDLVEAIDKQISRLPMHSM